jgi:hypothetical protein
MTWGFPAQRRADEFDALVEGGTAPGGARDAELLELVGAMRSAPQPTPRPEFVAELREQLMAAAATELVPADVSRLTLPQRRPSRERRVAALVGGIAVVGATTSVAMAAQSALPGDSLYPVKRAIESAHAGLAVGEGSKGATILSSATDRLDEAAGLAEQDDFGDDLRIADTLDTFTDQATEGSDLLLADYADTGDASSIVRLRSFAASSLEKIETLEPLVPADARDELLRAAAIVRTIDAEAARRCPSCAEAPVVSIPASLASVEQIVLPPASAAHPAQQHSGAGPANGGRDPSDDDGAGSGPDLPQVDGALPPGSVQDPDGGASPGAQLPDAQATGSSNPLQDLANGLVGGGTKPSTSPSLPSVPVVSGLVDDVGSLLQGIVDPTAAPSQQP